MARLADGTNNVVRCFGSGVHLGHPFIVMENLSGGTLDDRLPQINTIWEKVSVALSIARALQHIHTSCLPDFVVMHRDLKPNNVAFDAENNCKLVDFGLSRVIEARPGAATCPLARRARRLGLRRSSFDSSFDGLDGALDSMKGTLDNTLRSAISEGSSGEEDRSDSGSSSRDGGSCGRSDEERKESHGKSQFEPGVSPFMFFDSPPPPTETIESRGIRGSKNVLGGADDELIFGDLSHSAGNVSLSAGNGMVVPLPPPPPPPGLSDTHLLDDFFFEMTGETGSLRYMAPEVGSNETYNHKADVYSWAVVAWQVFTKSTPYTGFSVQKFQEHVVTGGYRMPLPSTWPAGLAPLVSKAWAKNAKDRPNMREIVEALEGISEELAAKKLLAEQGGGGCGGCSIF